MKVEFDGCVTATLKNPAVDSIFSLFPTSTSTEEQQLGRWYRRTTVTQRPSIIKSALILLENKNSPGETYTEKPQITFSTCSDSNE